MPRATSGFSVPSSGRSKSSERPSLRRRSTGESLSEAPLPHLVRPQRAEEVDLPEARPIHVDEVQFGVGELPQEEVRDPLLSARAEYEVRIRQVRRVEALREELLVDVVRADGARLRVADDVANRLKDLLPAAVCNGDVESVFLVSFRPVFRKFSVNRCMRCWTSVLGRCKFSVEKAKTVRMRTPTSRHHSRTSSSLSRPFTWPSRTLPRPISRANRRLPSMMIAT